MMKDLAKPARLIPPFRIAEFREKRRLSQAALGIIMQNHPDPGHASKAELEAAGREIADYESGQRIPSWERLVAIAQSLGLTDVRELIAPMPVEHWARLLDQVELENFGVAASDATNDDTECRSDLTAHTAART